MFRNYLLVLLFVLSTLTNTLAQDYPKSSIAFGAGIGFVDSNPLIGSGFLVNVGYQYEPYPRVRLSPNLTSGYFNAAHIKDAGNQEFVSSNLEAIASFDFVDKKNIEFAVSGGGVLNYTNGKIGPSFFNNDPTTTYINDWRAAWYAGLGLRIKTYNKRLIVDFQPLNLHFTKDWIEFYAKIGLVLRFKKN